MENHMKKIIVSKRNNVVISTLSRVFFLYKQCIHKTNWLEKDVTQI